MGVFKLLQGRTHAPEIWYYLKSLNAFIITAVAATLIMFQYPQALMICLIEFIMLFVYPLVPLTTAFNFTWKQYVLRAVFSIIWLTTTVTGIVLIMFGTIIDQEGYDVYRVSTRLINMAHQALLDYECVGSRVWFIMMLTILPNILMIFKILTN